MFLCKCAAKEVEKYHQIADLPSGHICRIILKEAICCGGYVMSGNKAAVKGIAGKIRLNTDTDFLKLVAIVSMLIDHLGARVFPQYVEMRYIGRLAFPLFAYCMAVGCVFTKNIGKYALRVGIMAILVQPLYVTAMGHQQMMSLTMPLMLINSLHFTPIFLQTMKK
jgi:hypothetical protein